MEIRIQKRQNSVAAILALLLLAGACLILAPKASALEFEAQDQTDCPSSYVCVWEGPTFGGNRAFFHGYETGCHALANIDPRSAWNHTGNHSALLVGLTLLSPGQAISGIVYPFTGELCIS